MHEDKCDVLPGFESLEEAAECGLGSKLRELKSHHSSECKGNGFHLMRPFPT